MSDVESRTTQSPEWASRALAAEFEPLPQIGVVQAARRYWYLVLLPVLVLVPVALYVASKRTPTYTAEARLIVGRLNLSTPGAVQGFAGAAQDLAATYPLVIGADGVVNSVARELGTTPGAVRANLSASEVPSSAVVRVIATGSSANAAIALANAGSTSLVAFLSKFNRDSPDTARLGAQLKSAELAYQRAAAALAAANTNPPLDSSTQKLAAAVDVAKVRVGAVSSNYQTSLQNDATSSLLQPLVSAHSAGSDQQSKRQISVFIALVCALLVGLALATLWANWVARSALMAPTWQPDGAHSPTES
jgi:uncharacterized protein involved in exopolysaccharide biosynthesis